MSIISGIVAQTGVQLEAQAFNTFGAVVQNSTNAVLGSIFGTGAVSSASATPAANFSGTSQSTAGLWNPTPYASAFASGAGGFDPKLKFLFKVTFHFNPNVAAEIASLLGLANAAQFAANMTFAVKQIDLPKYAFEYDEVNMYNFRTKILKCIKHEELSFAMYDTVGNHALDFVNAYLQLIMPSSRQPYTSDYALWDHGFAFTSSPTQGNDTGSRGALGANGSSINIIDSIQIDQYYLNRDQVQQLKGANIVNAVLANSFVFTNPRLSRFEIQDQDAEKGSEPNMINCTFDFDTLYIKTKQPGATVNAAGPTMKDDILSSATGVGQNTSPQGITNAAGGGGTGNPFLNIIAGAGGAIVASSVGTVLSKTGFANVPGGAQSIAAISGTLGTNAARTLASVGSTAPGITLQNQVALTDNSTPATMVQNLSSQDIPPPGFS